jgi:transcriptional regulator with XRE-family HTH domain
VARRFGENLTSAREEAGITQEELAYRASIHRTEVGLLERGGRVPRIDTLVKLAGALGVEAKDLLSGLSWQPGSFQRKAFDIEGEEAALRG